MRPIDHYLLDAVTERSVHKIKFAMMAGGDVNARYYKDSTIFMYVAEMCSPEIVSMLIKKANINAKNKLGETALSLAILLGNDMVSTMLIEAGADVNSCIFPDKSILCYITKRKDYVGKKLIKMLTDRGAKNNREEP